MKVIPLSEGSFTIDKSKLFVPFDDQQDDLQQRPTGSLLVEVQPFVVITEKDVLLLDTGLGFSTNGKLQLHENLIKAGINPSEVTKVLMSHLHKDHAGGVSEDGDRTKLSFPQATYYVQQRELDFALQKGLPSFIPEELEVLKNSPQVKFLTEDEGDIDGYIHYKVTGAHSPFHQVFWIKENNETIFFGADDAPQLQQMKHRFAAKYDHDGKKAMELRREWWEDGRGWTFLFYHDIKAATYTNEARITADDRE
ncbi:MBL fold metallo-hydrolase [Terrimonas sp. NA20]|uniref:MBL fold metallo-hydrolase n=1 Tax=Terrimonas ginsenosidimutans TaxID=2908004 RepID=A0ABS9KQ96_9BACT|nr:MBL fold metallo-hydrolase [Terrimonas ginsenosidimutans]MCG2614498.1 MBL fold metallo-hydrolase [Terrimonas ginsenosidimutans]